MCCATITGYELMSPGSTQVGVAAHRWVWQHTGGCGSTQKLPWPLYIYRPGIYFTLYAVRVHNVLTTSPPCSLRFLSATSRHTSISRIYTEQGVGVEQGVKGVRVRAGCEG